MEFDDDEPERGDGHPCGVEQWAMAVVVAVVVGACVERWMRADPAWVP